MASGHRQKIIKAVTFFAGLYFFLEWVTPASILKQIGVEQAHESITNGFITVGFMAIGLGLINLFMVYGSKVVFRRPGWLNGAVLLLSLLFMLTITAGDWISTERLSRESARFTHLGNFAKKITHDEEKEIENLPPKDFRVERLVAATEELLQEQKSKFEARAAQVIVDKKQAAQYKAYLDDINNLQAQLEPQLVTVVSNPSKDELLAVSNSLHALGVAEGQVLRFEYGFSTLSNLWRLMFDGLFVSLSTAMFSLLGVYIASAAYRAFRIRSFEAVLMMTAAVLVMLGQIPFGVYIYSGMPEIRDWILRVPNSAAFRAITIGTGIAGLVMAFRMWFSIESDFGSEEG